MMVVLGAALMAHEGRPAASQSSGTPARAWEAYREGERRARDGDLDAALHAYMEAAAGIVSAAPVDRSLADALALALYNLAVPLTGSGRIEPSLRCFEEICRLRKAAGNLREPAFMTTVIEAARQVAAYAVSAGRAGAALPLYRAISEAEPDREEASLDLATALLAAGEIEEAARVARSVRRIHPRSARSWVLTAKASLAEADRLVARSRHTEARRSVEWAVDDLRQAAKIEEGDGSRLAALGAALGRLGRLLREEGGFREADAAADRALAALDEAARLEPGRAEVWIERGRILREQARYAESAEAFAKALDVLTNAQGASAEAAAAREERAHVLFDEAGDALNTGRFDEAASLVAELRRAGALPREELEIVASSLEGSRRGYRLTVEENEKTLAAQTRRGDCLLALGDIHFRYGNYEAADEYYMRLARAQEERPPESLIHDRLRRIAPAGSGFGRAVEVEAVGARLTILPPAGEGPGRALDGAALAWKRVSAALGPMPEQPPLIRMHAGQQAFRTAAGPRAGSALATGAWARGEIHVWRDPGRDAGMWTSVLAPPLACWAADRLSRGRAPWWVVEGLARLVSGDSARDGGVPPASPNGWVPVGLLDRARAASWNDPERLPELQAEAGLLIGTLVSLKGSEAPRALLLALATGAGPPIDEALRASAGIGLDDLERAARVQASVPVPAVAP